MRPDPAPRDAGLSLVELGISMLITSLVLILMGMWVVSANRMERYQSEAKDAIDEIRMAKDTLVKELRFANGVSLDPARVNAHKVTFWVDNRTQGTRRLPDTGIGEWITWELTSDGRLLRSTDKPGDPVVTQARGLVYYSLGSPGSVFTYPASGTVGIRLVADPNPGAGAGAEVIETKVTMRNA